MKEIKNKYMETIKNEELNEEDILTDILMSEKNISFMYSYIMSEMSNKYLYKKIIDIFEDSKNMIRDLENLMFHKGWSSIIQEEESKIEDIYLKYCTKLSELS